MMYVTILTALCFALCLGSRASAKSADDLRVSYPEGVIDTLQPWVAFIGPPHDKWQAQVQSEQGVVWDSGEMSSREYRTRCATLPGSSAFSARVRVLVDGHWSDWSQQSAFQTPPSPVVRLLEPIDAGRVIGPRVRVRWDAEVAPGSELGSLEVRVDDQAVQIELKAGEQEVFLDVKSGLHSVQVRAESHISKASAASRFFVWRSPQETGEIVVLDISEVGSWDIQNNSENSVRMYELLHAAACLQGIVNRPRPRMAVRLMPQDDEWLAYLRKQGAWLEKATFTTVKSEGNPEQAIVDVLKRFPDAVNGLVVWDENVNATSNVATTASGVEDLLPVRSTQSLLGRAFGEAGLNVKLDLRGRFKGSGTIWETSEPSTGSAKCDAYIWARERYLDTGRCNARKLGYWLDAFWLTNPGRLPWWEHCLSNHDWITKHRGFVFDLSNWDDETPQDDPGQKLGTDLETFKSIMASACNQAKGHLIHVSGFTPWAHKYTEISNPPGKHHAVHTEWEVVRILSAYNAYLDADAIGTSAMANASFWSWMPLPERYLQNPAPSPLELRKRGYMDKDGALAPLGFTLMYVGDFDSAAWLYHREQDLWAQSTRGSVPMGWAFNPNLSERLAPGLHFAFENKTPQDFLTAGDSGAGYVNPTVLQSPRPISGLPSAEDLWVEHCQRFFRQFDYSITGFLINGHAGQLTEGAERMTARFSPDGTATQPHWNRGDNHLTAGMPVALIYGDLDANVEASAAMMAQHRRQGEQFLAFRIILLGPDYVTQLITRAQGLQPDRPFALLDPYTFYYLLRHSLGGTNGSRAAWSFDTLGSEIAAGQSFSFEIGVRNNGWDTWGEDCALRWGIARAEDWNTACAVRTGQKVAPGEALVTAIGGVAPEEPGDYLLYADFERSGKPFRESGSLPYVRHLSVRKR